MVPIAYPTTAISNMENQLRLFSLAQDYSTAWLGVTCKELGSFFRSHHEITVYGTRRFVTCRVQVTLSWTGRIQSHSDTMSLSSPSFLYRSLHQRPHSTFFVSYCRTPVLYATFFRIPTSPHSLRHKHVTFLQQAMACRTTQCKVGLHTAGHVYGTQCTFLLGRLVN